MGLFQNLAGNMQEMNPQEAQQLYGVWLVEGEQITTAFRLVRDGFAMTSHRIILMDRQGATGKKTRVMSIPLNAVVAVTAETAGGGLDDSELTLTYITTPRLRSHDVGYASYTFEFPKSFDVAALYRYFQTLAMRNVHELNKD